MLQLNGKMYRVPAPKGAATMTTSVTHLQHRILLRSCPRCRGDLFPELEDQDTFACLQCGRRFDGAQLTVERQPESVLVPAA